MDKNRERIKEFDIARGLSIVFMILVHVYEEASVSESVALNYIMEIPGSYMASTVFLIILGANTVLTEKNPSALAVRGVKMLLISYLYNFIVYYIPYTAENLLFDNVWRASALNDLVCTDILQFAALAFLFIALWKKLKINDIVVLVIICTLQILRMLFLADIWFEEGSYVQIWICGLFFGASNYSFFPFIPWIIYPSVGVLLGKAILKSKDRGKIYKVLFPAGMVMAVVGFVADYLIFPEQNLWIGSLRANEWFYIHNIFGNVAMVGFALAFISLIYFVRNIIPSFAGNILTYWSKNITLMYFIQYGLITYLLIIKKGQPCLSTWPTVIAGILCIIATDLLVRLYRKITGKKSDINRK